MKVVAGFKLPCPMRD